MTKLTDDLVAARIAAQRAREQLMQSAQALQSRLSPKVLARGAWEGAKEKGATLADKSVDAVRERPLAAAGIATAIALFLARKPLGDLAGRMAASDDEIDEEFDTETM